MTKLSPVSVDSESLRKAIADNQHALSLHMLQQLPLRNRWDTLFLLNRTFSRGGSKDYVRALTHDLLYRAYREELTGNFDEASRLYRLLIQHHTGHKITQKARDGFKRIASGKPHTQLDLKHINDLNVQPSSVQLSPLSEHEPSLIESQSIPSFDQTQVPVSQRLAQANHALSVQPSSLADHEPSLVVLQPIPSSQKQPLVAPFAKILGADLYTARYTLPSIEFRILRHGLAADMRLLHHSLTRAGIPHRHVSLKVIQDLPVYDVLYIEAVEDSLVLQVRDPNFPKNANRMEFSWSDIQQSVEGLLPLFEDVIERDRKGKITRKTTTQDHAQICDLHLRNHQGILRFYDAGYQFNQGIALVAIENPRAMLDTKTSWAQWQGLKKMLGAYLPPIVEHHKFDHFATNAVEQIEILAKIEAHIHLLRRHESYWDQAFHLYSALHYLQLS